MGNCWAPLLHKSKAWTRQGLFFAYTVRYSNPDQNQQSTATRSVSLILATIQFVQTVLSLVPVMVQLRLRGEQSMKVMFNMGCSQAVLNAAVARGQPLDPTGVRYRSAPDADVHSIHW